MGTHTLAAKLVVMAAAEKMLLALLPDYCLSEINFRDQYIKDCFEDLDLKHSDLPDVKIAVAGLGAILEVANLVMGVKNGKLTPGEVTFFNIS